MTGFPERRFDPPAKKRSKYPDIAERAPGRGTCSAFFSFGSFRNRKKMIQYKHMEKNIHVSSVKVFVYSPAMPTLKELEDGLV